LVVRTNVRVVDLEAVCLHQRWRSSHQWKRAAK
jgi:hypothetical protein